MNRYSSLPGFLMTSEVGSFAQDTILHRKPKIIDDVIASNDYPSHITERLTHFKEEIRGGEVQPLTEEARDVEQWNMMWQEFKDNTWLELPWYFAEAYFYRRLLEAIEYFQPGPLESYDPFQISKQGQLEESMAPLSVALEGIEGMRSRRMRFENLLHGSLWGNRVDLSNITITDEVRRRQGLVERENLLINDFSAVLEVSEAGSTSRVAFINDNVGMELGFDLSLADFLLLNSWADEITFYLKPYPFFVSDAMPKDLEETLRALVEAPSLALSQLGKRMRKAVSNGTLRISADWYWASARHFHEMPEQLYRELSCLDIVILKGDVNYRRLLGDRHWPYTTPVEKIVHYFPTSLLILRTLKGEIAVGLKEGQAEKLEAEDPEWLTNGERGMIQYVRCGSS